MTFTFKHLEQLIAEYGRMTALDGLTAQERGRRFNDLIAEVLLSWGINAEANVKSKGEIDVAFELGGRHFVVEAKWEKTKTDTGAVAKLQKRVRQRMHGTIGVFISIAGFSDDALKDLKDGEQLTLLLLSRKHFEAMLTGFVRPDELINELVKKASRRGIGFSELEDLFASPYKSEMNPRFESPPEIPQLVVDAIEGFEAEIKLSDIPFGQSGVAEENVGAIIVTSSEGIFRVSLATAILENILRFPNCSRSALVAPDGSIYVVRRSGVGRLQKGVFELVAGGLAGNVSLSLDANDSVWAFSNGSDADERNRISPAAVRLGADLSAQTKIAVDYPASTAHSAAVIDDGRILVLGPSISLVTPAGRHDIVSARDNRLNNPGGLVRLDNNRFLIACNSVELWELDLRDQSLRKVASLRLNGSVYELAPSCDGGGYLSSHYANSHGATRGIIVRWNYPVTVR